MQYYKFYLRVIHQPVNLSYYPFCVGDVPRKRPSQFPEEVPPSKRDSTIASSNLI